MTTPQRSVLVGAARVRACGNYERQDHLVATPPVPELALLRAAGWTRWPARLPEQLIFYPVVNREYAVRIASDWNVEADGAGYVDEFEVRRDYLDGFDVHQIGGATILEYWIPAEELETLNVNIVGLIRVVDEFVAAVRDQVGVRS